MSSKSRSELKRSKWWTGCIAGILSIELANVIIDRIAEVGDKREM